jgi:hypothetical protein
MAGLVPAISRHAGCRRAFCSLSPEDLADVATGAERREHIALSEQTWLSIDLPDEAAPRRTRVPLTREHPMLCRIDFDVREGDQQDRMDRANPADVSLSNPSVGRKPGDATGATKSACSACIIFLSARKLSFPQSQRQCMFRLRKGNFRADKLRRWMWSTRITSRACRPHPTH